MHNRERFWKLLSLILAVALAFSLYLTTVDAGQPHMRSALRSLQTAKHQLQKATSDKEGHRVNAMNYVDKAITEVNLGIKAGAE